MKRNLVLSILIAVCCAGCVTGAVNPFFTPETVVDSEEYEGKWYGLEKDQDGHELRTPLEISDGRILILEEGDAPEEGAITFFKVDGQLFADMQLDKAEGQQKNENSPHLLFKVLQAPAQLSFIPLDYVWLVEEIGAGNINLPVIKDEDKSSTLFTASSSQWGEFIKTHKDSDYAFPPKDQFVLRRNE